MKPEIIYGFLALIICINLFMLFKISLGRKSNNSKPNNKKFNNRRSKKNNVTNINTSQREIKDDFSREDKTEVAGIDVNMEINSFKKQPPKVFIPNLSDEDKTEIEVDEDEDMDATTIEEKEVIPSVYGTLEFKEQGEMRKYEITKEVVLVGRDPKQCNLCIKGDNFLGRCHGKFIVEGSKVYFEDLDSKNGSFIDGKRLTEKIEVKDGIVIRVAHTEISFKK